MIGIAYVSIETVIAQHLGGTTSSFFTGQYRRKRDSMPTDIRSESNAATHLKCADFIDINLILDYLLEPNAENWSRQDPNSQQKLTIETISSIVCISYT